MTANVKGSSIASDSVSAMALRVSLYATGLLGSILISRALGPAGRGTYYLPVVTAATVCAMVNMGLEQANVYLLANGRVRMARLWAQAGLFAAVMGTLGLAATLLAPAVLPSLYRATPAVLLLLAGLSIPLTLHTQTTAGLLTLQGRVTLQFRAGLVGSVVQVGLLGALAASGTLDVVSVLAAALVGTSCTWWLIGGQGVKLGFRWIAWDRSLLRETLAHSVPLHLSSLLLFLHLRLDMFMVSAWAGAAALGLYSLAVTLSETVQIATDSLSIALTPRQVGNSLTEASEISLRGVRTNAIIGLGLAAGWLAFGYPVIVFAFGNDFAPAYLSLVLLLPGIVCLGMQRACGGAILRSGRTWELVAIQGGSLSVNAVLNVLLIPSMGAPGAAVASTISYTVAMGVFVVWTSRMAGVRLAAGALPRLADLEVIWRAGRRLVQATGAAGSSDSTRS